MKKTCPSCHNLNVNKVILTYLDTNENIEISTEFSDIHIHMYKTKITSGDIQNTPWEYVYEISFHPRLNRELLNNYKFPSDEFKNEINRQYNTDEFKSDQLKLKDIFIDDNIKFPRTFSNSIVLNINGKDYNEDVEYDYDHKNASILTRIKYNKKETEFNGY